jgi:uncharacterized protein YacL
MSGDLLSAERFLSIEGLSLSGLMFYLTFIYPPGRSVLHETSEDVEEIFSAMVISGTLTGSLGAIVLLQITNFLSSKYLSSSSCSSCSDSLMMTNIFLSMISLCSGIFQTLLGRGEANPDYFG